MSVSAGRFGAARASSAAFLIPAEALFLGVIFRGEHVSWISIVGGAVCITGALIMRGETTVKKPSVALASASAE
jgi:drug/metabolite transporter (DMT)-like permease